MARFSALPHPLLLSIPEDQRRIEPTTVEGHHDLAAARFASLYTRDEPTVANFQLKAEIGPSPRLKTPFQIEIDLCTWSDVFNRAIKHYLGPETSHGAIPAWPAPQIFEPMPLLAPSSVTYDDSRPVIKSGVYIDRIDRRTAYVRVDYDELKPDTTDFQVVESALYGLTYYMRDQLKRWYNRSVHPVRPDGTVAEAMDMKNKLKHQWWPDQYDKNGIER